MPEKRDRRKESPADETPKTHPLRNGGTGNSGGNYGNVYGAGPHRKSFRAKAARAADEGLDFWVKVARGNKVIPVYDALGREKGTRNPTLKERKDAFTEILLRFGIGTQDEVLVLQSADVLNLLADVLPEFAGRTLDEVCADEILAAMESRVGGQGT